MRRTFIRTSFCVLFFVGVSICGFAGSEAAPQGASGLDQNSQACTAKEPPDLRDDYARWYLRSVLYLDCLASKLEKGRGDSVTFSAAELEEMRTLVSAAKDAVGRSIRTQ